MKNTLLILSLFFLLIRCATNLSHLETTTKYYNAYNKSSYTEIKSCINDSITIISGDYVMPYTINGFYEIFKWDSIFKPTYEIIALTEKNNQVIATVASHSLRYEFLKNNPLTSQFRISFKAGKISKIEDLNYPGTDWTIWQKERDSLVSWIAKNHPELDGFIYDMSLKGAQNYTKAITRYKTDREDFSSSN